MKRLAILIDTPKEFPQSGFQWSVNHIKFEYKGTINLSTISQSEMSKESK